MATPQTSCRHYSIGPQVCQNCMMERNMRLGGPSSYLDQENFAIEQYRRQASVRRQIEADTRVLYNQQPNSYTIYGDDRTIASNMIGDATPSQLGDNYLYPTEIDELDLVGEEPLPSRRRPAVQRPAPPAQQRSLTTAQRRRPVQDGWPLPYQSIGVNQRNPSMPNGSPSQGTRGERRPPLQPNGNSRSTGHLRIQTVYSRGGPRRNITIDGNTSSAANDISLRGRNVTVEYDYSSGSDENEDDDEVMRGYHRREEEYRRWQYSRR